MPLNLVHAALQIAFDWHGYHLHAGSALVFRPAAEPVA